MRSGRRKTGGAHGGIGMLALLIAGAVAAYGVCLQATVGAELQPRGAIGLACLLAAAVIGSFSYFAFRR